MATSGLERYFRPMVQPESDMTTPRTTVETESSRKPQDEEVDVYGLTHPGKVRKENQDHFLICSLEKQVRIHQTSLPDAEELPLSGDRLAFLAKVRLRVQWRPVVLSGTFARWFNRSRI